MGDAGTVRELLANHAERMFVGRSDELAILSTILETSIPPVTFIHGIGGIGKSRLLEAFATHARAVEAYVVRLDCRQFEPTLSGFLRELGSAVGSDMASVAEAAERLASPTQAGKSGGIDREEAKKFRSYCFAQAWVSLAAF